MYECLLAVIEWRPGRTLVLCSWDAEEYGLIGSTEWVEVREGWRGEGEREGREGEGEERGRGGRGGGHGEGEERGRGGDGEREGGREGKGRRGDREGKGEGRRERVIND